MAEVKTKAAGGLGDKAGAEATPPKPKKQPKAAAPKQAAEPVKEEPVAPTVASPKQPQPFTRKVFGGGVIL